MKIETAQPQAVAGFASEAEGDASIDAAGDRLAARLREVALEVGQQDPAMQVMIVAIVATRVPDGLSASLHRSVKALIGDTRRMAEHVAAYATEIAREAPCGCPRCKRAAAAGEGKPH